METIVRKLLTFLIALASIVFALSQPAFAQPATTQPNVNNTVGAFGTGKTLGGVTMGLGSDATGDVYYNNGGVLTRLPKGTNGQALELVSGLPAWVSVSPYFQAFANGTQTITSGSLAKIQINTKVSDSNTWYDATTNFRFTPQLAGRYLVTANALCQGTTVTHVLRSLRRMAQHLARQLGQGTARL